MTTPEIEREKLIEHLMSAEFMSQGIYFDASNEAKGYCSWNINKVVDFILADRARIVEECAKIAESKAKEIIDMQTGLRSNPALEIAEALRRAGRKD
jgi:hypothetical protein